MISDSIPSQRLTEVVITASRYGTIRVKTPEAIRVVDDKSIQKFQLRTAAEALLLTPGVFVQKTNHGGGSPFLRGLTGNQTLLLVDGIRLSNATMRYGPNQYFNTIDVFSLEKIEVLRGSGSVQYGSDAIGGTIQAFSHEVFTSDNPNWEGSILSRISSQGMEQSLNGRVNYAGRKLAFRGGATARDFGDLVGGDTTGRQSPTGYSELDFDLKSRISFSRTSDLTMTYQRVHQRNVPVFHKIALENYAVNKMDPQSRDLAYLKLNHKFDAGIIESAVFTVSLQHSEEGRKLMKNGSSIMRIENDKVRTFSFSTEAFASGSEIWSADSGLELYNDLVNSSRTDKNLLTGVPEIKRGLYPDAATMTSFSAFSIHTIDLQNWKFTAGARYNLFVIKVRDEVVGLSKIKPSAFIGNMAVMRKLNLKSNLFISINTGFRAPNIDDLGSLGIVDFRYETPNIGLRPEHSLQYQAGYKYQGNKVKGEIYLYRNELYDLIVRTRQGNDSIDGYPVYQKVNSERAYIQGIETEWTAEVNKSFMVSASVTYTYGQNVTKREPMRRIPPVFGRVNAGYRLGNWLFNTEWQAAGRQDRLAAGDREDNRIPTGGTPAWNIFNLNAGFTMRYFQVSLSLLNILDEDYRFHGSGVNGYGRSAFLSVIVNFK